MDFDNLVAVFGYSIVTGSMSKMFDFSMLLSSRVIIFDCSTDFNKSEEFLGYLTGRCCLMFCEIVYFCFLKRIYLS